MNEVVDHVPLLLHLVGELPEKQALAAALKDPLI